MSEPAGWRYYEMDPLDSIRVLDSLKPAEEFAGEMLDWEATLAEVEQDRALEEGSLGAEPTPIHDSLLHNPWDGSCSRWITGEPTQADAVCPVCFPASVCTEKDCTQRAGHKGPHVHVVDGTAYARGMVSLAADPTPVWEGGLAYWKDLVTRGEELEGHEVKVAIDASWKVD